MHFDMASAWIARIAREGCRALRAILKTLGIFTVCMGLHGVFRAERRAMVEKLQSFLDCTIARQSAPLQGVCHWRANHPFGVGAATMQATRLTKIKNQITTSPRDTDRRQDRPASPTHGLQPGSPK